MPTSPPFLPPSIANLTATCGTCGRIIKPNLWTRSDEPFLPIYPTGTKGEVGAWIQASSSVSCVCGSRVHFPMNHKRLNHALYLYGDEADRQVSNFDYHSYSLVGGTSGPIGDMSVAVKELKKKLIPDREPDDWRIHVADMIDGRRRIQSGIYRNLKSDDIMIFLENCAGILKSAEAYTWNTHVSVSIRIERDRKLRKKYLEHVKVSAHSAILSYCIFNSTYQGLRPFFILDASKPIKNYPHIEGWSRNSYLGSRHYLGHAFLTHNNEISPPEFAKPGSHPCLELADVHSYFAARNVFRRCQGTSPEIPLAKFGRFYYLMLQDDQKFEHVRGDDIPYSYLPVKTV